MNHGTVHEIDLWEAWVEFDPVSENSFGTLYIIGEAVTDKKCRQPFVRQSDNEIEGRLNLFLQRTENEPGKRREIIYAEPIYHPGQYRSVAVYSNGSLVAEISHIEVMI
jgi:hypothetical protein